MSRPTADGAHARPDLVVGAIYMLTLTVPERGVHGRQRSRPAERLRGIVRIVSQGDDMIAVGHPTNPLAPRAYYPRAWVTSAERMVPTV